MIDLSRRAPRRPCITTLSAPISQKRSKSVANLNLPNPPKSVAMSDKDVITIDDDDDVVMLNENHEVYADDDVHNDIAACFDDDDKRKNYDDEESSFGLLMDSINVRSNEMKLVSKLILPKNRLKPGEFAYRMSKGVTSFFKKNGFSNNTCSNLPGFTPSSTINYARLEKDNPSLKMLLPKAQEFLKENGINISNEELHRHFLFCFDGTGSNTRNRFQEFANRIKRTEDFVLDMLVFCDPFGAVTEVFNHIAKVPNVARCHFRVGVIANDISNRYHQYGRKHRKINFKIVLNFRHACSVLVAEAAAIRMLKLAASPAGYNSLRISVCFNTKPGFDSPSFSNAAKKHKKLCLYVVHCLDSAEVSGSSVTPCSRKYGEVYSLHTGTVLKNVPRTVTNHLMSIGNVNAFTCQLCNDTSKGSSIVYESVNDVIEHQMAEHILESEEFSCTKCSFIGSLVEVRKHLEEVQHEI